MTVKRTAKKTAKVSRSTNRVIPAANVVEGRPGSRHSLTNFREADRGEFRGDFTRDTFDTHNRFSRVLMQQGRVQVDADWNEQASITLHYLRNLACDIGSEHWGPHQDAGFKISLDEGDAGEPQVRIGAGHYYVKGLLCEAGFDHNGKQYSYSNQPDYPLPDGQKLEDIEPQIVAGQMFALVYLDVWERHYTYINDDSIREVALSGPDTATRAKIIWQVKILPIPFEGNQKGDDGFKHLKANYRDFLSLIDPEVKPGKGRLCAKVKDKANDDNTPCLVAPESRYRGAENQLYRIEIHKTGVAEAATYKWSRENASVTFPIVSIQGLTMTLEHLGKDCRYGLKPNDWVELIDDEHVLQCRADNLFQVESIEKESRQVTLSNTSGAIKIDVNKHAYLRRWDHVVGNETGIAVAEKPEGEMWLEIENGIQVQFKGSKEAVFKTGDYWLIPARTATGDIEWPARNDGQPQALLPHGVVHHYAPLAILNKGDDKEQPIDLRRRMAQNWEYY